MKFLSSSSSSAASTTTTAAAASTANCLAGMLRRLLCFNSLPAHPSDQIINFNSVDFDKLVCLETEGKSTVNPGIVARLMGLEPMPRIDFSDTQMVTNSIARSRSMNFDSWREKEAKQGQQRRDKTSLAFRQLPTFLENEDFFVLSFENLGEIKEFGLKADISEVDFGKLKRRKADRCRRKCDRRRENVPEERDRENQDPKTRINHKADASTEESKSINYENGGKQRKEKGEDSIAANEVETECDSENSSPVSVLDFVESIFDPKVSKSEEDAKSSGPNSRRKLSADLENYDHSSAPSSPSSSTCNAQKRKNSNCKKDIHKQICVERWGEICKMAEGEMMESKWVYRELWKLEAFRDIGVECELQILEILLSELVDLLVET